MSQFNYDFCFGERAGTSHLFTLLEVDYRPEIRINKLQFMKSIFALIAVGLDAAATRFKSKIKETAAAVVVGGCRSRSSLGAFGGGARHFVAFVPVSFH